MTGWMASAALCVTRAQVHTLILISDCELLPGDV
jgi:hypothetical protein